MEGSSGTRPVIQTPSVKEEEDDEAAVALTKRARKRSRYLSPPYTDTDAQEKKGSAGGSHEQQQQVAAKEVPPDVSTAEVLSSLRAAALWEWQVQGQAGADAAAPLRFLALYRDRSSNSFDNHPDPLHATAGGGSRDDGRGEPPSAAGAGVHKMLRLNNAGSAMPTGGDGVLILAKKKKSNKKRDPLQSPVTAAAAAVSGPMPMGSVANPVGLGQPPNNKKRKYRRRMMGPVQHYFENPVALVLDFAEGTPLPSKEDLISAFRRFGFVIDSETAIAHDKRSARVAFAARAQAEAASSCAETLGTLGLPSAAASLHDLPPITLNTPPPLPKLPLMDIRNNLEKMILSLTCSSSLFEAAAAAAAAASSTPEARPASGNLVEEMQGLLAKVNKRLQGASATDYHRL